MFSKLSLHLLRKTVASVLSTSPAISQLAILKTLGTIFFNTPYSTVSHVIGKYFANFKLQLHSSNFKNGLTINQDFAYLLSSSGISFIRISTRFIRERARLLSCMETGSYTLYSANSQKDNSNFSNSVNI